MSENKNLNLSQLLRIRLLLTHLKRNPYQTQEVILDYFEANDKSFTERTFYRLKQTLARDFGIEIVFDYKKQGYFFDEEKSTNPESFLSLLEVVTTAELFSTNFKEKNNALSFLEFENRAVIETIPTFKTILTAIQKQLPITFKHYSFYHLKEESYTLKPYFLKQYQNRWYVIGETEKGYRTFGIDRIATIVQGTKKFKFKTEEAKDKFSHVIGLNYVDHPLEKIKLSFHPSQKPYLVSLPLHRSQKEVSSINEDSFDIELLIHPNFEFNQQLLKYGSLVTVVEPKWLVDEIKKEIKKVLRNYK
ncbi:Predicted DNA-binding transcriptional regulator YafY, contains an HTH and WYL domains [Flavobacterium micromati]|uniref:Predicted DNA-binding transcriptional regulator YafY, contains an HTH and WYL domains n=1 Tax=Flavobacterium micromati TaxID=229205 RepID=A0A1M5JVX2_9FLAO|nr:WYL domain-containing protein [Flavobacterium micromati]SHG44742.1 Predicted DNA-binding transcriptional regulator YafY, contains an HTH and WYL domains [Flavobacterium micromati]